MPLPTFLAGARITAAQLAALLPVRAFKPSDTVVVSTTTITADPDLLIPVLASAEYEIDMQLIYTQGTVGQLVLGWTGPTLATLDWVCYDLTTTVTASDIGSVSVQARGITDLKTIGGNTATVVVRATGRLVTASTPGSLVFRWGPSAVSATGTTVKAGSYLVGRQIA